MSEAETRLNQKARIRHPKVKTGCITCRTRRVKCDETRPACLRCQKYGTDCEGYLPGRRRPPSSLYGTFNTEARALIPKTQGADALLLQPPTFAFENEQEHLYFGLFADKIASEISPYFNPESWRRLMLQACVTDSSIRHAAIAIGALGKAYEVAHLVCGPVNGPRLLSDVQRVANISPRSHLMSVNEIRSEALKNEAYSHHRQALEQYDKAIKRMRSDIMQGNQNLRTTLIICIMCICFEAIHGNHESAAGQLQSGLAVVQEWKSHQRNADKHPLGFSSPATDVVDDFLIQTFGRMEIQSMSVFDPRSAEVHLQLKHEGKEVVERMPTTFSSIEEARVYLDLITRRLMHFNTSIHKSRPMPPASAQGTPLCKPIPELHGKMPQPIPFIDGKIPLDQSQNIRSSRALLTEQGMLDSELFAWNEAFRSQLTQARSTGGRDAISALTMTISAIASSISLRAAFFINETAYDTFLPKFKIIVDYSRILVELQKSQARLAKMRDGELGTDGFNSINSSNTPESTIHFAFEIGIVPPLYLVMVKCREPNLRRSALRLLEENPRREGVWDSVAISALGRWVIDLEEEGMRRFSAQTVPPIAVDEDSEADSPIQSQESYPHGRKPSSNWGSSPDAQPKTAFAPVNTIFLPEEMRVRKAHMRFDLLARKANMSCTHLDLDTGLPLLKKATFTW